MGGVGIRYVSRISMPCFLPLSHSLVHLNPSSFAALWIYQYIVLKSNPIPLYPPHHV